MFDNIVLYSKEIPLIVPASRRSNTKMTGYPVVINVYDMVGKVRLLSLRDQVENISWEETDVIEVIKHLPTVFKKKNFIVLIVSSL